jgi:CTP:molybdopterin cytidylyltransferase MocA
MGQPKINLPWGNTTVLGQVVRTLLAGGVTDLVVVTGADAPAAGQDWPPDRVRCLPLPEAELGDMLASLRFGLSHLRPQTGAALIMPGDMPAVPVAVIQAVAAVWQVEGKALVVPSVHMRRGHPWLAARHLWSEIAALRPGLTLRDFLNRHASQIHYVPVDAPGVLLDLDTPEDYGQHP